MKLPVNIVIPDEKLTGYLLFPRIWNDKSKFLSQAGFTSTNSGRLKKELALQKELATLAQKAEAVEDGVNEYGIFYRTDGELTGPNGRSLPVTAIWMRRETDGVVCFITLKPRREK